MLEFGCTNENGGDNSGAVMYLGSFCGLMTFCADEPLAYLNKRRLDLMTINFVGGGDDSFYSYYCFNLTILDQEAQILDLYSAAADEESTEVSPIRRPPALLGVLFCV